ncbi:MAG: hypothetical protein AAB511_02785 [Patescibacteria group bacterium]
MAFVQVLSFYILWHYTKAWQDLFRIISNYLWFVSNYFSIGLLWRTLFDPWRRMSIVGGKGSKDSFVGAILINTFMRAVGFLIRTVTILGGLFVLLIAVSLSCILILAWAFLPVIVFILFFAGLGQILKGVM